jgi:glycosyltransferase involved in cell wall biosynthesis
MYLGIDCIALPRNFSGAANYIVNLSQNILSTKRSFGIHIYCKPQHSALFKKYLQVDDSLFEINIKSRFHQLLFYEWSLPSLLIKNQTGIFLATHYITPPENTGYKIISIFHDMGFLLHSHYYPFLKRIYFKRMIPLFIKRSAMIVTVSRNTWNELIHIYPQAQSKSNYIYPGTNHMDNFSGKAMNGPSEKPFILAVNAFEKRKNISLILNIFEALKERYKIKHNLIIAGRPNNHFRQLKINHKRSPFKDSIFVLTDVSNNELKTLYSKADFFVNTSTYEGFGFTPAEAISQGCPAFLYTNRVVKEIYGEHPYLINSVKAEKWAVTIKAEMDNKFRNKLNNSILKKLSWQKCADNFRELIESM